VLHIEDDVNIANTVQRLFQMVPYAQVAIYHVPTLEAGLVALQGDTWDCVLLDLTLPDSSGIATFHQVHGFTDVPIVVLTAEENLERRAEVVGAGAQDCIYKMEMTPDLLIRCIRFAVERNRIVQELRVALKEVQAAHRAMQAILDDDNTPT
jgi:DNA-binding response OmpR family regulator